MRILAAIVLFNPDLQRLRENILSVSKQVDGIALFNNGRPVPDQICPQGSILEAGGENIGVAAALNRICQYAVTNNYDWVLTLDQDSICPDGLVDEYKNYIGDSSVGMICPRIHDRNYGSLTYDGEEGTGVEEIDACITSAALMRLSAWKDVNGFWDELFIDMVDFDICWSLKESGYKILRTRAKALLHEIGHSRRVRFLGKENVVFNHPPIRSYYMARNTIAVGRKHHRLTQCIRWCLKRFILINCFEDNKWQKDKQFAKGIIDCFKLAL